MNQEQKEQKLRAVAHAIDGHCLKCQSFGKDGYLATQKLARRLALLELASLLIDFRSKSARQKIKVISGACKQCYETSGGTDATLSHELTCGIRPEGGLLINED